jgi:hypothetical protein
MGPGSKSGAIYDVFAVRGNMLKTAAKADPPGPITTIGRRVVNRR